MRLEYEIEAQFDSWAYGVEVKRCYLPDKLKRIGARISISALL